MDVPEQIAAATVEATYKTREVEGFADIYFYRRIGFWLAQRFAERRISPATVTLIGGVFGLAAGHLYFYPSVVINLMGLALHVIANALDNADGQLARLTNQQSKSGRILDSVVDHVIWIGVYFHLALRGFVHGGSLWIWVLALAAGMSHGTQAAAADYCRSAYIYFVKGKSKASFDSGTDLQQRFRAVPWPGNFLEKLLMLVYMNATYQQERLMPFVARLHQASERAFPDEIPDWLRSRYSTLARPVMKWCGWLMTNVRMFLLFFLFLGSRPTWFFWIELTVFNCVLGYVLLQQREISDSVRDLIEHPPPA